MTCNLDDRIDSTTQRDQVKMILIIKTDLQKFRISPLHDITRLVIVD